MSRSRHGLALLTLLVLAAAARAGDPTPQEQFSKRLDALPAAAAAHVITFEGDILMGDQPFGTMSLSSIPIDLPGGERGWKIEERLEMMGGTMKRVATAVVDRRLQPLRGTVEQLDPGSPGTTTRWESGKDGYRIERTVVGQDDAEPERRVVARNGDCLTTITSLWLFCRMTLPAEGAFATNIFEPGAKGEEKIYEPGTWELPGEGDWDGKTAWLMTGDKGGMKVQAAYDKATKTFLGAKFLREGAPTMAFRPKSATPKKVEDVFVAPAASAKHAAMTAGLAFATADIDLVDQIVHWPSVHASMKAKHDAQTAGQENPEPFPDQKALRASTLENLRTSLKKRPRAQIEAGLRMVESQLVTEVDESGRTRVKFPEMFRSMVLVVGEVNGGWYLVEFPS